ncbi:hypothetical protein BGZ57DRAFT_905768 [Hyaloscypha finlandica]|nr:hypothetical protein BGZ57DRAFT_905768 [Hyaloscypha finlandica]
MLTLYKNSFLINSNAVYNIKDCRGEMAAESFLRMLSHPYVDRKRSNGPFFLSFIDLYAGNTFVDRHWNVVCLMDSSALCGGLIRQRMTALHI